MSERRPLRVLHLGPASGTASGIAAYASRFRSALTEAGVAVDALGVPEGGGLRDIRRYSARAVALAGSGHHDVVHIELGGGNPATFYAARALQRETGVAQFLTLHEPPRAIWRPFEVGRARDVRTARALLRAADPLARQVEQRVIDDAAAVFVLSEAGRAALAPTTSVPVIALPYPVPIRPAAPRSENGGLRVGFFGYWYQGKGIELLVKAVARVEGVHAEIWGGPPQTGTPRAHAAYARRVRVAAEGTARVRLAGPLAEADVPAALASCDAIVLPYESPRRFAGLASISAAMFDAFAAATPVVAADVRSLRETTRDGVNGLLVPPGDTAALAAALTRLRDDARLRARLREGARATALAHAPARTAEAAMTAYENALGDASARTRHDARPCSRGDRAGGSTTVRAPTRAP